MFSFFHYCQSRTSSKNKGQRRFTYMKKWCLKLAIDFSSGVTLVKCFVVGSFHSCLEIDKSP